MSSKRYPEEFKVEAVRQVVDRGRSVAEVASRPGVTTHSLYAWLKKYGPQATESIRPRLASKPRSVVCRMNSSGSPRSATS